eukprot:2768700-Alexandrium_andersonii.AAC.1
MVDRLARVGTQISTGVPTRERERGGEKERAVPQCSQRESYNRDREVSHAQIPMALPCVCVSVCVCACVRACPHVHRLGPVMRLRQCLWAHACMSKLAGSHNSMPLHAKAVEKVVAERVHVLAIGFAGQ